jgi:hypothetical protein
MAKNYKYYKKNEKYEIKIQTKKKINKYLN